MKEFNCKALSTWLSCDDWRGKAFTAWCINGKVSQLDYILAPRMCTGTSYIHNEVKLCGAWDHHPVCSIVQDAEGQVQKSQKKRGWVGWKPVREEDKRKFEMKVAGAEETEAGKGLEEIQKQIEAAARAINFSKRTMRLNAEDKKSRRRGRS